MKRLFIVVLGSIMLTACGEKFISTVDLGIQSKPVIGCFLTPGDSILEVSVTMSVPISSRDQRYPIRRDAVVRLVSDTESLTLTYTDSTQTFLILAPTFVVPGRRYRLQVELDGKRYEAETRVPELYNPQLSLEFTKTVATDPFFSDTVYNFRKNWKAPAFGPHYFASIVLHQGFDLDGKLLYQVPITDDFTSALDLSYFTSNTPSRDFQRRIEEVYLNFVFDPTRETERFAARLYYGDFAFYKYHESVDNNWWSSGDFFTEPSPVYSSFDDAFGAFGSYIKLETSIPFR